MNGFVRHGRKISSSLSGLIGNRFKKVKQDLCQKILVVGNCIDRFFMIYLGKALKFYIFFVYYVNVINQKSNKICFE